MAALTNTSNETLAISDLQLRTADGVIGDLEIRSAVLALSDFETFAADRPPATHYPFVDFEPGEYAMKDALIGFRFTPADGSNETLALTAAKVVVDVPDITARGSSAVVAGGTTITFPRRFTVAPQVVAVPQQGTAAICVITAVTVTTFTVRLFDPAAPATGIAGTVHWQAIGY